MVEKSKDPQGIWVLRTPEEKWHKDCIHGVTKGPGIKLMVWACIWGKNKSPLIRIFDKSVNRFVYIGVLEDGLVDVWQEVEDTVGILSFSRMVQRYILQGILWLGLQETRYRLWNDHAIPQTSILLSTVGSD